MRIFLVILANIFVIVVSVLGVNEYYQLKRFSVFTVPFTDKMIRLGVISAEKREGLLKEERIGHYVGILLSVAVWLMLAKFIAGISAIPVFIAACAVQLLAMKPELTETDATRSQYFNIHKKDMDPLKYHEYLQTLQSCEAEADV